MAGHTVVAKRYARAVFAAASAAGKSREWLDQLQGLTNAWAMPNDLAKTLLNPAFSIQERHRVLDSVCLGLGSATELRNLLKVLLDGDRLAVLPELCAQLETMVQRAEGLTPVLVESALPLTEEQSKSLKSLLETRLGTRVDLQITIRPEFLAGIRVQWKGMTWDATLGSGLRQMKQALLKRV